MSFEKELLERASGQCELCKSTENLQSLLIAPKQGNSSDDFILTCKTCHDQASGSEPMVADHWRCLNDSIWSEIPAVKVLSWRMLHKLSNESWTADLLDMMYLTDDELSWAKDGYVSPEDVVIHRDSNGAVLSEGDNVVLIKDLNVKGANFTAKRGTAVRNIKLVADNSAQIEGKVNGQEIVILTQFVKKSN